MNLAVCETLALTPCNVFGNNAWLDLFGEGVTILLDENTFSYILLHFHSAEYNPSVANYQYRIKKRGGISPSLSIS